MIKSKGVTVPTSSTISYYIKITFFKIVPKEIHRVINTSSYFRPHFTSNSVVVSSYSHNFWSIKPNISWSFVYRGVSRVVCIKHCINIYLRKEYPVIVFVDKRAVKFNILCVCNIAFQLFCNSRSRAGNARYICTPYFHFPIDILLCVYGVCNISFVIMACVYRRVEMYRFNFLFTFVCTCYPQLYVYRGVMLFYIYSKILPYSIIY